MRSAIFAFGWCLLVAGCSSPSPAFLDGSARDLTVDDSRFRVFIQHGSKEVEAHRISFEPLPSLVQTLKKAYRAIELATGCQVVPGSLTGDHAIIKADVDCAIV